MKTIFFVRHAKSSKADPYLSHKDGYGILIQFFDLCDCYDSIMIVGHNPALSEFVNGY